MSRIHNGHLFTDAGQLTCLTGAAGVPASAVDLAGWAHAHTGEPYVEDLVAGAVPAGSVLHGAWAFHPDGRLYVTSEAVAVTDTRLGGVRVRTDGAVRISTAALAATDQAQAGWMVATTGEGRVSIT